MRVRVRIRVRVRVRIWVRVRVSVRARGRVRVNQDAPVVEGLAQLLVGAAEGGDELEGEGQREEERE